MGTFPYGHIARNLYRVCEDNGSGGGDKTAPREPTYTSAKSGASDRPGSGLKMAEGIGRPKVPHIERGIMERKTFLKILTWAGGLATSGVVAVPALITGLAPALRSREEPLWQPVGRPEEFPLNDVRKAIVAAPGPEWANSMRVKAVFVWRPSMDEFVVFSQNCTDLSCPIAWDPGSGCFFCPCHGGIFARNGERLAGPPKRPLYRYANRIHNGLVEIDLHSLPPMT